MGSMSYSFHVVFLPSLRRWCKTLRGCQLVVRVKRRSVARAAPCTPEYGLLCLSRRIKLVWIRRRPEGINVHRQGVQLFIAVAALDEEVLRIRQILEVREVSWVRKTVKIGDRVATLIQRCIAHEVDNSAMLLESRAIEITPTFDANKIRYLRRVEDTCAMACYYASWYHIVTGSHGIE